MNSSSNNNDSEMVPAIDAVQLRSIELHSFVFPATCSMLVCVLLAVMPNLIVALTVAVKQKLRSKSFYILSALMAVADVLVGGAYSYVAMWRAVVHLQGEGAVRTRLHCLFYVLPMTFSITSSTMFNCVVSLDRLLAVTLPIKYTRFTKWIYLSIMAGLAWVYSFIDMLFVYFRMDTMTTLLPICTNIGSYSSGYNNWVMGSRTFWSVSSVVICVLADILIRWRLTSTSGGAANNEGNMREVAKSTGTIMTIVAITFLTQICSRIGFAAISGFEPSRRSRYGSFLRVPQILNSAVNLFVYLWRSNQFRSVLCHGGRNQIVPRDNWTM